MKALVLQAPEKLVMKDVERPSPGYGEILIRTRAATICTSDFADIAYNPFGITLPAVMGHEGAGVVAETGRGVTGFSPGDRVTTHPVIHCGDCDSCVRGLMHMCDRMEHLGINRGGTFAEYYVIRQDRARKIPEGLDFPEATLMEPVSVCIEAVERSEVEKGKKVLIIGDGPFGFIMSRLCAMRGAAQVIMLGRHSFRMGMTENVVCVNEKSSRNPLEEIIGATGGSGVDAAILCVASPIAVDIGIAALRSRGIFTVFSGIAGKTPVDLFKVHVKELSIRGSCNDPDYLDSALDILHKGDRAIRSVITHRVPFAEWERAFHLAENEKDSAMKASLIF